VFRPSSGIFFLRNTVSSGFADYVLTFGVPSDKPVAGHWNKSGTPFVSQPGSST